MYKTILNYWDEKNETVVTDNGFRYLDRTSIIKGTKEIEAMTEIGLFEQFYILNNRLRYCNGTYYKFQDVEMEQKYNEWLKSDHYKEKSFDLYYMNGVVD
jgi:hypothetical protein